MDKVTQRFIENVVFIAKQRKIQIGEFEKELGVSVGYFSRMKKHEKTISLDLAYKISRKLGYGVEQMIESDFTKEIKIAKIKEKINELMVELEKIEAE